MAVNVEAGLRIIEGLVARRSAVGLSTVIAVGGGTGSGKTERVAKPAAVNGRHPGLLVSMDDWNLGRRRMLELSRGGPENWDYPEQYGIDSVARWLTGLQAGCPVLKPVYSFATGEPSGVESVCPGDVVVIEGLYALDRRIAALADLRVFVEVPAPIRLHRRIGRDLKRTGQTVQEIIAQFEATAEPMYRRFVEPTRSVADLVIDNSATLAADEVEEFSAAA